MKLQLRQYRRDLPPDVADERLHAAFLAATTENEQFGADISGELKWGRFEWRHRSTKEDGEPLFPIVASAEIREREGRKVLEGGIRVSAFVCTLPLAGCVLLVWNWPDSSSAGSVVSRGFLDIAGLSIGVLAFIFAPLLAWSSCAPLIRFMNRVVDAAATAPNQSSQPTPTIRRG